jgi:adenosylhomocysteine nucleosidase
MKKSAFSLILLSVFQHAAYADPDIIGVINPQPEGSHIILNALQHKKSTRINGITYTEGTYNNHQIVQATSGEGTVNSAIVTASLIENFHPSFLLLSGIAGGLGTQTALGDVVIGQKVVAVEHDRNFAYTFIGDSQILKNISLNGTGHRVIQGTIVTSSNFPDPPDIVGIMQKYQAKAVEMEGAAFMQTCQFFHTPCLVIRGISDIVYNHENKKYQPLQRSQKIAIANSSAVLLAILNQKEIS